MKVKKLLLALAVFAVMAVVCVVYAGAETYGDFEYSVRYDDTVVITDYNGSAEKVDIPAEIDGNSVTEIYDNAFSDCASFTTITIPDSVTSIGYCAFKGCTSLTSIIIPDGVKSIEASTFESCESLTSVTIPDSVTKIDRHAFYNCTSLKYVVIPASVTYVWEEAFGYNFNGYDDDNYAISKKADDFKISYTKNTFGHWYATKNGFSDESCLVTNELDDGTLEIDRYAGNDKIYVIPTEIDGKMVTKIHYEAFRDCTELTDITIPDSITSIDEWAFFGCTSLKNVDIPESVQDIGFFAFGFCYKDDVTSEIIKVSDFNIKYTQNSYGHWYAIKYGFVEGTCLVTKELDDSTVSIIKYVGISTSYSIPSEIDGKKVTKIENEAFSYCEELESVTIPSSITSIGSKAFIECTSLKTITIPSSVTFIGDYAFGYHIDNDMNYVKVENIKINYTKNTYGHYYATKNGFSNETCLLAKERYDGTLSIYATVSDEKSVIIPSKINGKKITQIGEKSFAYNTTLTSVTIPDGVTDIDYAAFSGCTSLTSVTIPNSVENIRWEAFCQCTSLKSVIIPESVTFIGNNAFGYNWNYSKVDGFKISYTKNTYGHYYATKNGFSDETCLITSKLDDGTLSIDYYISNDKTFSVPSEIDGAKVTEINSDAFEGNTMLTSVVISDSVTSIGGEAFYNCKSLKSIIIPASVVYIGDYAFGYYEDNNDWYDEPAKVEDFKISYFQNTYGHYYAYKNGFTDEPCQIVVKQLYDGTLSIIVFDGNDKTFNVPSEMNGKKITQIGDYAFEDNTTLISVTISDGVMLIGNDAFVNCPSLKSVTIPASVTSIGYKAFGYCYDGIHYTKVDGFKINYAKNTYGHYYATANGFSNEACLVTDELYDGTLGINKYAGNSAIFAIPDEINGKKITQIYSDAFKDHTELTSITIPGSIKLINSAAFINCTSLKEVTIPASAEIGSYAFGYYYTDSWEIKKMDDFKINYVKNTWGHLYAVRNGFTDESCLITTKLNDDELSIIGYGGNDKTYVIPTEIEGQKVTEISSYVFSNCSELTSITIPDSVTGIGWRAFYNCTSLKLITIPASVNIITAEAFGYYEDTDTWEIKKVDRFIIYCYSGTAGEKYAKDNGFDYVLLDHTTHTVDNWTVTKAATCTTDGTKTGICSVCGKTETQTIKALGHSYSTAWTTDKVATCGVAGSKSHRCTRCSAKKDVTAIPATGKHTFGAWKTTKAATYTATGTKTRTCTVCKKTETATIAKLTLAKVNGFKSKTKDSTSITLQWNKNNSASGYIIEAYNGKTWSQVAKITSNNTLTYKVTRLSASKTYQYRIKAYKTEGKATAYSANSATLSVNTNPSGMSGYKVKSKTATSVTLLWNKNASTTGYELQKWDGKKWVSLTKINKNSTTTYTVKSLKASTTYKYRIRAYKTIGKATQYSAYTATLSVNTNPSNMSGFKAKSKSYNSVTLQWNKNTSATGYELQKWDGKKWVALTKITKNSTTTYTVKSLKASTTYKYRIRAYKTIGKATQYSGYTELSVNTNPSNMSGFKAKSTAKTSVTLQWNKNTSATGYEIQKWDGKKWVSTAKVTKNSTVTSTVKSLKANTSYKFRIRAYKTTGKTTQYSSWSSTLTVKTKR